MWNVDGEWRRVSKFTLIFDRQIVYNTCSGLFCSPRLKSRVQSTDCRQSSRTQTWSGTIQLWTLSLSEKWSSIRAPSFSPWITEPLWRSVHDIHETHAKKRWEAVWNMNKIKLTRLMPRLNRISSGHLRRTDFLMHRSLRSLTNPDGTSLSETPEHFVILTLRSVNNSSDTPPLLSPKDPKWWN